MKFELDQTDRHLTIRSYGAREIVVGDQRLTRPVVLCGASIDIDLLPPTLEQLGPAHIERLCALGVDLLLIGTGSRQVFLDPALTAPLLSRGIGCESMDTAAACRSYNVLIAESRSVAAALFMLTPTS
jgi:uncharacterized protein